MTHDLSPHDDATNYANNELKRAHGIDQFCFGVNMKFQWMPCVRGVTGLILAAGLSACVSVPKDRGADTLLMHINKTMPEDAALQWPNTGADGRELALLAQPLSAKSAMLLALLRNPEMQLLYADLGLSWAEVSDAARISNPVVSYQRLRPNDGGVLDKISYGLTQDLADLLLLGARKRLAQGELKRTSAQITAQVLTLARDAEVAYYQMLGAKQVLGMRTLSAKAMQNSATLAQRFFDAGNITRGQLASEQAGAAQAQIELEHANAAVFAARAALNGLLALPAHDQQLKLDAKLPEIVSTEDLPADLQALATAQRADLVAADVYLASAEDFARSAKRWRWLGALEVGYARDREDDGARFAGLSLSLGLPIFNQGQGSVLRASAYAEKAAALRTQTVLRVQSEVQTASAQLASARTLVGIYRDQLVPARTAVVEAQQKRFNFMLIGAFELLQGKREEYDAYQGYFEALSAYWVARAELARAIGGNLPSDQNIAKAAVDLPAESNSQGAIPETAADIDQSKPIYVCPMHEHSRSNNASDKCPICGMALELETPLDQPHHQHDGGAP